MMKAKAKSMEPKIRVPGSHREGSRLHSAKDNIPKMKEMERIRMITDIIICFIRHGSNSPFSIF